MDNPDSLTSDQIVEIVLGHLIYFAISKQVQDQEQSVDEKLKSIADLCCAMCNHQEIERVGPGELSLLTTLVNRKIRGETLPPVPPRPKPHIAIHPKGKVFVVGDIHGCAVEFSELIQQMYCNHGDTIICVGDIVNKGPNSLFLLRTFQSLRFLSVRGNHDEEAIIQYERHVRGEGIEKPGFEWVTELSPGDVAWMKSLPYTISIPEWNYIIVHAGLVPGVTLEQQDPMAMTKMRNLVDVGCEFTWSESHNEGHPWVDRWHGPYHVIFGHDAAKRLQRASFATGIDTGCCYGGQLTAISLPTQDLFQVQAHAVYSKKTLAET